MSQLDLTAFQEHVWREGDASERLRRTLAAIEDRTEFVAAVIDAAREHGFDVQEGDVQEGMQAARRAWIERWIA
jgi:hypothetical protein